MTKKGPLSKSEKTYIEENQQLPAGQIAEDLDRSEKSVSNYLGKLDKEEPAQEASDKPSVSVSIKGATDDAEGFKIPKAGELMARNEKYGSVIMTETASMAGDETKEERLPEEKVNVAPRHRGSIHKIKED